MIKYLKDLKYDLFLTWVEFKRIRRTRNTLNFD